MSLKEDLVTVKEQLNAEEQVIENYIKSERFFKRYKKVFIGVGIAFVLGATSYVGFNIYAEHNREKANEAYSILLKDPKNTSALETLKNSNERLYNIFMFAQAMHSDNVEALKKVAINQEPIISDIAAYQSALLSNDTVGMKKYGANQNAVFKELAVLAEAKTLMESGKSAKARDVLEKIPFDSPLKEAAMMMAHFTVKAKQ